MYIFYVIGYFVALLLFSKFKKKWVISTYIIAIYLFTLVVALTLGAIIPFFEDSKKGAFIFASGISLFVLPFLRNPPMIVGVDNPRSIKKLTDICVLISGFLVVLEILIMPAVIESFSVGFTELREGERSVESSNILILPFLKLMDFFNPLSFVLLTIFFYLFTFVKGCQGVKFLVFLASLSAPYFGIVTGGRTQMIYWLMSLIFNYFLFYKYLSPQRRKSLTKYSFVIIGIIVIYVGIATVDRFENTKLGTENSLLSYIGQPYWNFNNFIENYTSKSITLRRIFPFGYSLLYGNSSLQDYRDLVEAQSGMDIGIFYTLLGDLFVDIGLVGMYIYASVYFIVVYYILRKKTIKLSTLLIVSLLFLIPLQGVFYYSFWKRQVTFCAFLVILLSRILKKSKV